MTSRSNRHRFNPGVWRHLIWQVYPNCCCTSERSSQVVFIGVLRDLGTYGPMDWIIISRGVYNMEMKHIFIAVKQVLVADFVWPQGSTGELNKVKNRSIDLGGGGECG